MVWLSGRVTGTRRRRPLIAGCHRRRLAELGRGAEPLARPLPTSTPDIDPADGPACRCAGPCARRGCADRRDRCRSSLRPNAGHPSCLQGVDYGNARAAPRAGRRWADALAQAGGRVIARLGAQAQHRAALRRRIWDGDGAAGRARDAHWLSAGFKRGRAAWRFCSPIPLGRCGISSAFLWAAFRQRGRHASCPRRRCRSCGLRRSWVGLWPVGRRRAPASPAERCTRHHPGPRPGPRIRNGWRKCPTKLRFWQDCNLDGLDAPRARPSPPNRSPSSAR